MADRISIMGEIQSKLTELSTAGDVVIDINNKTNKQIVFEYYTDEIGEHHLKLHSKQDYDAGNVNPTGKLVTKDKIFFVLDLTDRISVREGK